MNAKELERMIKLGLQTVGEVAKYIQLMKTNTNELQVLTLIRQVHMR